MQLAKQTFVTKVKVTGNKKAIPQEVDSEVTKSGSKLSSRKSFGTARMPDQGMDSRPTIIYCRTDTFKLIFKVPNPKF